MLKLEVFSSPGCTRCGRAKNMVRRLAEELGAGRVQWREVNVLDEMDYAVSLGVLSTPAIAVDGELMFTGLPSARKLRDGLEARLTEPSSGSARARG